MAQHIFNYEGQSTYNDWLAFNEEYKQKTNKDIFESPVNFAHGVDDAELYIEQVASDYGRLRFTINMDNEYNNVVFTKTSLIESDKIALYLDGQTRYETDESDTVVTSLHYTVKPLGFISSIYTLASDTRLISDDGIDEPPGVVYGGISNIRVDIRYDYVNKFNIPLFATRDDAELYLTSGIERNIINKPSEEEEHITDDNRYSYYYRMVLKDGNNIIANRNMTIKCYVKITGYDNGNIPYNASFTHGLFFPGDLERLSRECEGVYFDGTTNHTFTDLETMLEYVSGEFAWLQNGYGDGTHNYYTGVSTNINMWRTKEEADDNANGRKPDEDSDNGGKPSKPNKNGDDMENTDNYTSRRKNVTTAFKLNEGQMAAFASGLYRQKSTSITDLIENCVMTTKPVDMVVSCYYMPIRINNFATFGASEPLKLGQWEVETPGGAVVEGNPIIKSEVFRIAQSYIYPIFNDFRDFSNVSCQLALPYVPIHPIDFKAIVGHNLAVDCVIDFYTATIKYYIKIDNKTIESFGANMGASLPIIASDEVSRSREIVNDVMSVTSGAISTGASIYGGNVGGAVSGTMGITNAIMDMGREPSMLISGSSSSATNCADTPYPYLIFDIQQCEIPSNLYANYGVPCNTVNTLNNCSGWTEAHDVKLVGVMLDSEKTAIIDYLANGVII